jgi:hypothetical protein
MRSGATLQLVQSKQCHAIARFQTVSPPKFVATFPFPNLAVVTTTNEVGAIGLEAPQPLIIGRFREHRTDQVWYFLHAWPVRPELGAVNIKEKPRIADFDSHPCSLCNRSADLPAIVHYLPLPGSRFAVTGGFCT